MEQKKIILPKGWEVDKIENGEIILKESKKELPKTWEECYKMLGKGDYMRLTDYSETQVIMDLECPTCATKKVTPMGLAKPVLALCQLLVCREVYRGGWKPDWSDDTFKYCIETINSEIVYSSYPATQKLLSFQSREVRDKFLENFRNLIEEAKELI